MGGLVGTTGNVVIAVGCFDGNLGGNLVVEGCIDLEGVIADSFVALALVL